MVGRSSIKSYKREYMITFFICESFMIVVFCMLDLFSDHSHQAMPQVPFSLKMN
jgi:hypothetical protein